MDSWLFRDCCFLWHLRLRICRWPSLSQLSTGSIKSRVEILQSKLIYGFAGAEFLAPRKSTKLLDAPLFRWVVGEKTPRGKQRPPQMEANAKNVLLHGSFFFSRKHIIRRISVWYKFERKTTNHIIKKTAQSSGSSLTVSDLRRCWMTSQHSWTGKHFGCLLIILAGLMQINNSTAHKHNHLQQNIPKI